MSINRILQAIEQVENRQEDPREAILSMSIEERQAEIHRLVLDVLSSMEPEALGDLVAEALALRADNLQALQDAVAASRARTEACRQEGARRRAQETPRKRQEPVEHTEHTEELEPMEGVTITAAVRGSDESALTDRQRQDMQAFERAFDDLK